MTRFDKDQTYRTKVGKIKTIYDLMNWRSDELRVASVRGRKIMNTSRIDFDSLGVWLRGVHYTFEQIEALNNECRRIVEFLETAVHLDG